MPGKTLYCLGEAWLELNSTAPLASAETFSPRMGGSAASLALAYAAQGGRASLLTHYHNPTEAVKLSICTNARMGVYCSLFLKTGRREGASCRARLYIVWAKRGWN